MTTFRLILRSLCYYWRTNLAVACGVAAGTAVLSGALLVGDSMRGSLRRLIFDRLGRIDAAMVTERLFRAELADEWAAAPAAAKQTCDAVPAILLRVSLENADPGSSARANRVELLGCDARFWQLGDGRPQRLPQPGEIVLNQPAAERLGVRVGQSVLLRLPSAGPIPADSALGRKQETIRSERLVLSEVIPAEGLGRFGLWPTQQIPLCAYVPLSWLGQRLGQPGGANAILVANSRGLTAPGENARPTWRPKLRDYGLRVERTPLGYWNITSDRMLLSPATEQAILKALDDLGIVQPALSYLANTLACGNREIPYSTVTALDFADRPPLGPFLSVAGKPLPPLGPDEIALNSWAAEQLHAKIGDTVRLRYFEPESVEGQVREQTVALRLAAVVRLAGAAGDRGLVPAVKGMTDVATMAGWNPPFPFDARRIRPADEAYWNRYGPTPKAFVSLAAGRRLWGSRFGQTTSIRVAVNDECRVMNNDELPDNPKVKDIHHSSFIIHHFDSFLEQRIDPAAMGFVFQPVKRQGLEAAAGTTPFGVLFLSFSFFIIAAAVMLVALLFRLGVERRAAQIGTLLALGFSRRQVGRLLLNEGLLVAAAGSLVGVPAGIAYAALMLLGLQTWWLAAITTPFLRLQMTAASLAIGGGSGLAVAAAAIWLSVRAFARIPPRRLLTGQYSVPLLGTSNARRKLTGQHCLFQAVARIGWLELLLVLLAVGPAAAMLLGHVGEELKVGMFFAAGALALLAMLGLVWLRLRAGMTGPAIAAGRGNLARMALRNAARNPGRSALTIGLVAAASFLIVAVSAFRLDPGRQTSALQGGDGGFALVAESDQPVFQDLDTPAGRRELGFSAAEEKLLAASTIVPLRVRAGDDASCLNLYRPRQPRLLGVPPRFVAHDGFAWADKPAGTPNPWELLDRKRWGGSSTATAAPGPIPVILEKNTANYALGLWGGLGETFTIPDAHGNPIRLQVVALLADSIFQGDLLTGEADFLRCFPDVSGYRLFLIETPPARTAAVQAAFEQALGDYGLAAETTGRRLAGFLAVQNTYLSTFQSLGGLGLLLGTFGLAAVQLRNVLERRGELALLRATGFRRATLAWLVLLEHAALLTAGLGIGVLAALLAVLPQMTGRAASLPWTSLAATLGTVLLVGLAAGGLAVRAVLRTPLLAALREER